MMQLDLLDPTCDLIELHLTLTSGLTFSIILGKLKLHNLM